VVHDVIFNASGTGIPDWIGRIHRELRGDRSLVGGRDPGAGSRADQFETGTVGSLVKRSSVTPVYGALLYRISHWFRPEVILELGTGAGVSALYLSAGSPGTPLHTVEGNEERAKFSDTLFKRCGLSEVQVHVGEMEQVLETLAPLLKGRILAFVDGNHRREPTLGYVRRIVSRAGEEAVIVMDDLYWSKEMHRAWEEITSWEEVRMSIDLYRMGILLLRRDLGKVRMKIKF
jgi:predicted O-methyltransferase YrrM